MQLRDYQIKIKDQAIELLNKFNIAYLSMEVRTGKTLTSLATAKDFGRILFVTKKKAIGSIENDAEMIGADVIVINYESVHKVDDDWDIVILDEAHCLGQFPVPAERTKFLKKICEGKPVIYLSGTPTPESYSQLFHQFYVSSYSPFKDYKNFYSWVKDYVIVKQKFLYGRSINCYKSAIEDKVREATKHLFISYTQAEAGFEQVVEDEVLRIPMSAATRIVMDRLLRDKVYITKDKDSIVADTSVKMQNKIHQICSGSVILDSGEAIVFDISKARYIRENFGDKKIGIFYKFRAEYMALLSVFGSDVLTDSPEEFNESSGKVFACQIQSGREGINLSSADCLIMYNIDFSAVSYWQSRARLQSKDRESSAKVYWLMTEGGIEEKIYRVVLSKKDYTLKYFEKDFIK